MLSFNNSDKLKNGGSIADLIFGYYLEVIIVPKKTVNFVIVKKTLNINPRT